MTRFFIYANVNPLNKHCLDIVYEYTLVCPHNYEKCLASLCAKANDLAAKGYNVEVREQVINKIDYIKFI